MTIQKQIDDLLAQANKLLSEAATLADIHNVKFVWYTPDGDHSFTYVPQTMTTDYAAQLIETGARLDDETRRRIVALLRNGDAFRESYEESCYGTGWVSSSAMC